MRTAWNHGERINHVKNGHIQHSTTPETQKCRESSQTSGFFGATGSSVHLIDDGAKLLLHITEKEGGTPLKNSAWCPSKTYTNPNPDAWPLQKLRLKKIISSTSYAKYGCRISIKAIVSTAMTGGKRIPSSKEPVNLIEHIHG